jgi:signal peptidase
LETTFILYLSLAVCVVSSGDGDSDPKKKLKPVLLFARDAGIAVAVVAGILIAMYAYTGLWPPLVVVESNSMMHSEENISYIGVIDTGDLVLVRDVDSVSDIQTYMDGYVTGHQTYGDYGDVIVYKVDGSDDSTPIIHRAMIYLEANADGESYSAEALKRIPKEEGKWNTSVTSDTWDHLTGALIIYDVGYKDATVYIDVGRIISSFRNTPITSGFITKGDHNDNPDQSIYSRSVPVKLSWIVGKARGEIPWFGLLKLWFSDSLGSEAPDNSVRNLWISLALIVIVPIIIDVVVTHKIRKRIARRRELALREVADENSKRNRMSNSQEEAPEPPQPDAPEGPVV